MTEIKFGTDGWRAVIAEDYTFENVRACAEGVARFLVSEGLAGQGLVIGYDTRFASEDFAAAAAEVVCAHGIPIYLTETPCPTPVACQAVLDRHAGGAVMITASHNPARYNGFKYKTREGGSAGNEIVAKLEGAIAAGQREGPPPRLGLDAAATRGLLQRIDPFPAYDAHVASTVDLDRIRGAGLSVVFDAMHAAAAGIIQRLAGGGATLVRELRGERNPAFPGMTSPEPIARNLGALMAEVTSRGAHCGLASDGDGDRLGLVDERGRFVDQLNTFALICYYFLEVRGERGPLVRSLTSTRMVDRLGELYGVPVHETPVGFKYLGPKLIETRALAAGEESGGYAFSAHIPERDGAYAALLVLDLLAATGKSVSQLLDDLYARVGRHFYDRLDVHLKPGEKEAVIERLAAARPGEIAGVEVVASDRPDGFRFQLAHGAWLLVRPSGTEPLLRIYTETRDETKVAAILQAGRALAGV
jgi:phosphomannomutase